MKHLIADFRLQRSYSRFLGRIAKLFALSAIVHLVVAVTRGWDWSGAVSFRKPVTFAVSFALMLWAMGWILDRLPARTRLGWPLSIALATGAVIETGLITMQSWRGKASHFNLVTEFDAGVFSLMGVTIGVVSAVLVIIAAWSFIEAPPGLRLAVGAGMTLVLLGLGLGVPLIEMGVQLYEKTGLVPDDLMIGTGGVAKFPHAMALHGLQVFIGAAVVSNRLPRPNRVVGLVVIGYLAMVAWSLIHTNLGRSPIDPRGLETLVLLVGVAAFAGAGASVLSASRSSRHTLPA
jgi:hypothetical protein